MELKDKKLFLLDIDGTVAVGEEFIKGAEDFLSYITSVGKYIFITNNSTKSDSDYIKKFEKMGLKTDESYFLTALDATVHFLKGKHKKIFVCGTKSCMEELRKNGINITDKYEADVDAVLVAYDSEVNYDKLYDACRILSEKDVPYYGTNPDLVCPAPFGFIPDCGSICHMIDVAVKKEPLYIGKPSPLMADMCLERTGYTKEETLVVGDRLYTDILIGVNSGIDSAAVLTGETTHEEIASSSYKPTYVFDSVKELLGEILKNDEN